MSRTTATTQRRKSAKAQNGAFTLALFSLWLLAGCGGPAVPTATPIPASLVRVPQPTPAFPDRADVFSNATPQAAVFAEPVRASEPTRAPQTPGAVSRALLRVAVSAQTPSAMGLAPGGGAIYDRPGGRVLGSIPSAGVVTVTGISADGAWYAVYDEAAVFGWTPASQLRIFGGDDLIVVDEAPDPGPVATLIAQAREPMTVLDVLMVEMATRTAPSAASRPGATAGILGTPTPAPTLAAGASAFVVSETRLNLRAAPATTAAIVAKLSPGAVVTVVSRDETGAWVQVETAAGAGWVAAEYLQTTEND
jgi:hypothetical protein